MRTRWICSLGLSALLVSVGALAGCQQTKISDIEMQPSRYEGDEITIAGKVVQSGGDFRKGSFEMDDGTGQLWVLTDKITLPPQGAKIAVTGLVEAGVNLGATSLPPILQEIRRYPSQGGD